MIPRYNNIPVIKIFQYLGSEPTYENFIWFVKTFLAPHMSSKFVEENYYKEVYDSIWQNRHCLLQMPRGHSKTELVGVWVTIFLVCCQPNNPFYTKYKKQITEQMLLAGDSASKHAWTERIKHFFYESPYLQWLLPAGMNAGDKDKVKKNDYWNERVMYFANGHKILLRAINERAVRGNHVDRLHADDLVTENSDAVDQAIKDRWDGAVDGTTTNKLAMVQVTGTPLRFSDILFHLKERGYYFKRLPAIIDMENQVILSPKRWTFNDLMITMARIGSVRFQCEYMLNPLDDSSSLIKAEWVRACFNANYDVMKSRPTFVKTLYLAVDFAFADRITADNSVFAIVGEIMTPEKTKKLLILDIILKKGMSVIEQFDYIKELNEVYHFDLIGVEENSIQAVSKHISGLNLPIKRFWTGGKDEKEESHDPKKNYTTVGKRNLILRLGTAFEQSNIIIPHKSEEAKIKADKLLQECISFAQEEEKIVEIGVHPDIPIAIGYANELFLRWGEKPLVFAKFPTR